MFTRFLATAAGLTASSVATAQGIVAVDLLRPFKDLIPPAHLRIVDVAADIATTDVWTAAGMRVVTENGATIDYFDGDQNTPGIQPGLLNPGTTNRFVTSLSKPRGRNSNSRFTNAGAALDGSYDPFDPDVVTEPDTLSVLYFADPPETTGSTSVDGYIARVSINISGVSPIPGFDINNYDFWGDSAIANIPSGAIVVARSVPVSQEFGTAISTFDVPTPSGVSWALWYIPEPSAFPLLALGGLIVSRRLRL